MTSTVHPRCPSALGTAMLHADVRRSNTVLDVDTFIDRAYDAADFCRGHWKAMTLAIIALIVIGVAGLVVLPAAQSATTSTTLTPVTSQPSQTASAQCAQAIHQVEQFVAAHPASAGHLTPALRSTFATHYDQLNHRCSATVANGIAAQVVGPWLPTVTPPSN